MSATNTATPFQRECYIMAKPAGALCQLRCAYCYYLEKQGLYNSKLLSHKANQPLDGSRLSSENSMQPINGLLQPSNASPQSANNSLQSSNDCPQSSEHSQTQACVLSQQSLMMSDALLERYTQQYIEMQTTGHVLFVWHGGEPTLRPLSFYQRAMELQRKYAGGRHIENALQTNGLRLTPEWCRFLRDNKWLVGISIDGPQSIHDAYRRDAQGRPTWQRVMEAIRMMQHYGVEWNAMAVVNNLNVKRPEDFYRFFKKIGCHYIQFTPIVERKASPDSGLLSPDEVGGRMTEMSVTPTEWGEFCCRVFDEWIKKDVGSTFVQLFDATLANWVGVTPGLCTMAKECGHAGVMEANGDLYSCDHFVFPAYRLGNIREHTLIEMMYGAKQSQFSARKYKGLSQKCRQCQWQRVCHGECPKNRILQDPQDLRPLNYLCEGYRMFFDHVAPKMNIMANLYRQGLPPADVMNFV